jgi:glycosyltransferase involved in cell wall biosynthesis
VNQKTSFRYEILLHDDASTDGSREIIEEYFKRYPDKIRAILQEKNQYSDGKLIGTEFMHPLVNGKYIALCEGDDYWPCVDKIQMQYDFLESHEGYSAVGGITKYFDDEDNEVLSPIPARKYAGKDAVEADFLNVPAANIGSNTLMYKTEYIREECYVNALRDSLKVGDIILMLHLFDRGKIFIIDEIFQNHRIQTRKNASNYNNIFNEKARLMHSIAVVKSVDNNLSGRHDLKKWIYHQTATYLSHCIKNNKLKDFRECYSSLPVRYKKNPMLMFIGEFPRLFMEKVKLK